MTLFNSLPNALSVIPLPQLPSSPNLGSSSCAQMYDFEFRHSGLLFSEGLTEYYNYSNGTVYSTCPSPTPSDELEAIEEEVYMEMLKPSSRHTETLPKLQAPDLILVRPNTGAGGSVFPAFGLTARINSPPPSDFEDDSTCSEENDGDSSSDAESFVSCRMYQYEDEDATPSQHIVHLDVPLSPKRKPHEFSRLSSKYRLQSLPNSRPMSIAHSVEQSLKSIKRASAPLPLRFEKYFSFSSTKGDRRGLQNSNTPTRDLFSPTSVMGGEPSLSELLMPTSPRTSSSFS